MLKKCIFTFKSLKTALLYTKKEGDFYEKTKENYGCPYIINSFNNVFDNKKSICKQLCKFI